MILGVTAPIVHSSPLCPRRIRSVSFHIPDLLTPDHIIQVELSPMVLHPLCNRPTSVTLALQSDTRQHTTMSSRRPNIQKQKQRQQHSSRGRKTHPKIPNHQIRSHPNTMLTRPYRTIPLTPNILNYSGELRGNPPRPIDGSLLAPGRGERRLSSTAASPTASTRHAALEACRPGALVVLRCAPTGGHELAFPLVARAALRFGAAAHVVGVAGAGVPDGFPAFAGAFRRGDADASDAVGAGAAAVEGAGSERIEGAWMGGGESEGEEEEGGAHG